MIAIDRPPSQNRMPAGFPGVGPRGGGGVVRRAGAGARGARRVGRRACRWRGLQRDQRRGRRPAVAGGQLVARRIACGVQVLRPLPVREALELLRADGQQRQRCLAAEPLQRFGVLRRGDGVLVEGDAAGDEHGAAGVARCALRAGVERHRIALHHLAQRIWQAGGAGLLRQCGGGGGHQGHGRKGALGRGHRKPRCSTVLQYLKPVAARPSPDGAAARPVAARVRGTP